LKKILWISVSPFHQSSFSIVSHNLLKRLGKKHTIFYLSIHYYGVPLKYENYTILQFSDHKQLTEYLRAIRPQVTVIYQSPLFIKSISHSFDEIRMYSKLIIYLPVEGYPIAEDISYLEKADLILVPSKYSQKCLEKEGYQSEVLYHGVDTQTFKPIFPLEQKYLKDSTLKMGTIAGHVWRKQLARLMDAYKLAIQKGLQNSEYYINCTTYDSTKWMPDLNIYGQKLDIPVKISKTSYLNLPLEHEKIALFYNKLHLHILPSSESFGLPHLEAMACGTVPIAIQEGAAPEIIGDCGIYVKIKDWLPTSMGRVALADIEDLAEKMLWASANKQHLKAQAEKAIKRAKMFNWENAALRLNSILEDIT